VEALAVNSGRDRFVQAAKQGSEGLWNGFCGPDYLLCPDAIDRHGQRSYRGLFSTLVLRNEVCDRVENGGLLATIFDEQTFLLAFALQQVPEATNQEVEHPDMSEDKKQEMMVGQVTPC